MSLDAIHPGVAPNLATPIAALAEKRCQLLTIASLPAKTKILTDYRRNILFNPIGESMLSKSQDLCLVSILHIDTILSGGRKNSCLCLSLVQQR